MDARAVGSDSIVIEGYFDPLTQKWQGKFSSNNISPHGDYIPTTFENTIFKHMDQVLLFRTGSATFYRNNHIRNYDAKGIFYQNKRVEVVHAVEASIFLENDSVFGEAAPTPRGLLHYFYFQGNTFENNKSGLIIKGGSYPLEGGWVNISRNIFRNNPATVISSHAIFNYVDNNLFIQNHPEENNLMKVGNYLAFRNNTLIHNEGTGVLHYEDQYSSNVGGDIMNNIFFNAPGKTVIQVTAKNTGLKIHHNSFSSDSTSILATADTAISIYSNLFSIYPEFKDTLKRDYTLKENSPIIDKGTDIAHGPVGTDFYYEKDFSGFPRKTGLAIDPGAYEYHTVMPLAFHYVTPDTIVCDRDTIILKAIPEGGYNESHFVFAWYRNGTKIWDSNLPYLTIKSVTSFDTAFYEAEMTNGTDTLRSGPIHLSVLQKPDLSLQPGYQLACAGMDLTLRVTRLQSLTDYWWTSAKEGPFNQPTPVLNLPNVVENDTLIITATNACGSAQSGPIILKIAPLPALSLGADTTLHAGDSLLLDAGEGVRYAWSTGETTEQVYGVPNDTVWVKITNAYGCAGGDTLVILMIPSGMKENYPENLKIIIYPNPAQERFFIRIPENVTLPCRLQVISMSGEILSVQEIVTSGDIETDLSKLVKGTYIIRLDTGSGRHTGKFTLK